jgi:hypothetical protein
MSRLSAVPQRVLAAVAEFYDDAPAMLAKPHDPRRAGGCGLAVPPGHGRDSERARRSDWLGRSRTVSIPNPTRRLQKQLTSQPQSLNDFPKTLQRATRQNLDRRPRMLNNPKAKRGPGERGTTIKA